MKYRETPRPHIKVGDVVLLYDEGTKRAFWKLAVVNELIQGSNDEVRAAVIKVSSDKGPAKLLKRSIQHLIPIKVSQEDDTTDLEKLMDTSTNDLVENLSSFEACDIGMTEDSV